MVQQAETTAQAAKVDDGAADIPAEERQRAEFYDFLAALLREPPTRATLDLLMALEAKERESEIGKAIDALGKLANRIGPNAASEEFHALFIGLGRGELLPYGSYYMTGFLNEKPLAALRQDMAAMAIKRTPTVFEPEDNIATLCEIMAGLIRGRFGDPASIERQKTFFNAHVSPWAHHFFTDLERAKNAVLYAPVGSLGRSFMEIEREAFRMEGAG